MQNGRLFAFIRLPEPDAGLRSETPSLRLALNYYLRDTSDLRSTTLEALHSKGFLREADEFFVKGKHDSANS